MSLKTDWLVSSLSVLVSLHAPMARINKMHGKDISEVNVDAI